MRHTVTTPVTPWWKFGHVWMVLAGPAVVVVASFFTFYLAYVGMDTVVDERYYHQGASPNPSARQTANSLAPALQARNHAATGVVAPHNEVIPAPARAAAD